MLKRLIVFLIVGICFGAKAGRDWTRFPAVVESDSNQDIYVVGDVHGDYKTLVRVLQGARVIGQKPPDPQHVDWIVNHAMVVFMGDLIDKGDHALDVIQFVQALRKAAQDKGGQVFCVMGNHEAEFLADPSEKKVQDFAQELNASHVTPAGVAACQGNIGSFLCGEPIGVRIRGWFFSHGGNTHGRTLAKLKADLQAGVDANGFGSQELVGADSILEARLGDKGVDGGPWFESGSGHDAKALLANYTGALRVKHIVQGHQPGKVVFADGVRREKGQMFQRYGTIFLVDTGMSDAIGDSAGAVLHITPEPVEQATVICPDGSTTPIWDAKTNPVLGKAKICGP